MRIGRADFYSGHPGRVHQAVLDAVPEDEAIPEAELLAAYHRVSGEEKPPFQQVVQELAHLLERRRIGAETYYIRRQPWLSTAEVARRLGVSRRTVQSWAQQGKLLGQQVGGRVRFAAESVEEWLRHGRGAPSHTAAQGPAAQVWDNQEDQAYDRA